MIRFLFRFIGLMLIALAFILFVYDGTRSIAGNKIFITQVDQVWSNVHQTSLLLLQPALENIAVWLWDPVVRTVLTAPSWLALAIIGAVLILLGRKKKPLIGYARD